VAFVVIDERFSAAARAISPTPLLILGLNYSTLHVVFRTTRDKDMAKPTSVRFDSELAERLDALAVAVNRPKTWLIEEAVRRYVDEQAWQVQAIQEALDDYRSGNAELVAHDQVMQRLEAKIKAKSST